MKKIGSICALFLLFTMTGSILSSSAQIHAQDFSLEASLSENQVFIGEQFSLKIEVTGSSLQNMELPRLPDLRGIRILSSNPSRGQSVSIVNGRTTTVTSYTYTLIARDEGTYRIPPITVLINGEEHTTNSLRVEVIEKRSLSDPSQRRPDIFAELEIDDEEPIVGQQLVASLVIYFREGVEVTSYQPSPGWRTDGFWKEQLENIEQPRAESVILGDVRYRKATLLRYALFPSRSGELTLTPFELNLGIRTQPQRNDPFGSVFGGLGTNQRRVTLKTEEVTLPVRRVELPETGMSIGAVGQFEIQRESSVTQAYVGEAIELRTTIKGDGNIPLINRPRYTFPENFEVYSPQEETDLNRRGTTISGTRTFNDRFVPRTAGTFTLPAEEIVWYNPQTKNFQSQTLPAIEYEIIRDPASTVADANQEVNLQIMTGLVSWNNNNRHRIPGGYWLLLGFLIPLIALAFAMRQRKFIKRLQTDGDFARSHHAWDKVEELLIKADDLARNESGYKEIYHLIHKALTGYITDRTGLPGAGLSDNRIYDELVERTNNRDLSGRVKKMLDKCSNISYAPIENREDIEFDIEKTRELLKELRARL